MRHGRRPVPTLPVLLVTVGTDHHQFDRLIEWTDRWLADGAEESVRCVVQHGASRPPKSGDGREYLDHAELQEAMGEAEIVVCHGGPATITEARRTGHVPIVVPRDGDRAEHVDDHQLRFTQHLGERGLIVRCDTEGDFRAALAAAVAHPERFRLDSPGAAARGDAPVSESVRRVSELIDDLLESRAGESLPAAAAASGTGGRASLQAAPAYSTEGAPLPQWPVVSVVISTRDRPGLLREAVEAVLAQDYPGAIDCVVVFDGTEPDHTLAAERPRRTVSVTTNSRTPGLAGGRNSGILAAGGELVAFCDDDDAWLPGKLRKQVELLHAEPQAAVVCTGITVAYEDHETDRTLALRHVHRDDLLRSRMAELHPSTFLMRRSALVDGFGLVDEALPGSYAEDYELLLRAAAHGPIVTIPDAAVRVRWHAKSHFASRWATIARGLDALLERHPDFRTVPRGYARVTGQIAFARAALGERREALRWIRRAVRANPAEPRAYLALLVASRTVTAQTVLRALHSRGRGL